CVVSGGTGGIGVRLVRRLALDFDARLLILGRTAEAVPEALRPLKDQVMMIAADVTDGAAVRAALIQAEAHFGLACRGAFHLAAAYHEAALAEGAAEGLPRPRPPKLGRARAR